jgi:hypothetical protein
MKILDPLLFKACMYLVSRTSGRSFPASSNETLSAKMRASIVCLHDSALIQKG